MPHPRRLSLLTTRFAVLALAGLVVAGCQSQGWFGVASKPGPTCPDVLPLRDAGALVRYKPGPGRDLTDVLFEAKVAGFSGECDWEKDRSKVTLDLGVAFEVVRGPANVDKTATFEYFVAVPAFYPKPAGKQTFSATVKFQGNISRLRTGDRLKLVIPVAKGKTGEDYPVYVGFKLSDEELRDNRKLIVR
jgi:hypothetical protein